MEDTKNKQANKLINSSSPYLLQHAYNPIEWYPWGDEALQKAKKEDKPIILSIGYSACHWCHVMEHESFEDKEIASLMNQFFICIKVDREERPDIDAIYMDAVSSMGQRGGWPLNVFLTPDTKPFYAGTYFPPDAWSRLLMNVSKVYKAQREELEESAENFKNAIAKSENEKYRLQGEDFYFSEEEFKEMFQNLAKNFDRERGGMEKAPKFPMPSLYFFMMSYFHKTQDSLAKEHTLFSLKEIAKGGIYDQIGGGFARYSVDGFWFVPHFEKMLYDNAQLIDLYTDAYTFSKDDFYKKIVFESIEFISREMTSEEGGFYSALDADSEGVEGKFYVWTEEELQNILKDDFILFKDYYNTQAHGNWEEGNNILKRRMTDKDFAQKHRIELSDLENKLEFWKKTLLEIREKRIRPGLDDKILCSWNGLMLKGITKAARVFGEEKFKNLAYQNADFILDKLKNNNGLWHNYKDGKASITAYLEDYATMIEAFVEVYQMDFEEKYLTEAKKLMEYSLENFWDEKEGMFFFTDKNAEKLIARKKEIFDNVIPASNSIMAKNLYRLGMILEENAYIRIAEKMLANVKHLLLTEIEYLANWASIALQINSPTAEVALIGEEITNYRQKIEQEYHPNIIFVGSKTASESLPLLKNRYLINDKTSIYVCFDKACQLPVNDVEKAIEQMQ